MREILFRAKSGQTWYYGGVFCKRVYFGAIGRDDYKMYWYMGTKDGDILRVLPKTICQYVGLEDCNGKKIFEGDIVRIVYDGKEFEYIVVWDEGDSDFKATNGKENYGNNFQYLGCCDEVEVVGNIYDNSDM